MAIGDLDLMTAFKTRMQWHQARQRVLAENVSNADTPNYKAKDLAQPVMPASVAERAPGAVRASAVQLATTQAGHMGGGTAGGFRSVDKPNFEVRPSGNAVDLEEQMTKSAENQLDYQMVASLYQQSLGLLRAAIGRK